jgi:hypothetical protein
MDNNLEKLNKKELLSIISKIKKSELISIINQQIGGGNNAIRKEIKFNINKLNNKEETNALKNNNLYNKL